MSTRDSIPVLQEGIVGNADGNLEFSQTVPVAELQSDMIIIQTMAISVNPVDTKMVDSYVTEGAISGCDMAGFVAAVGSDAAKHEIKVGDRVSATVMGMNPLEPRLGAFCQYVGTRPHVGLLHLPAKMSFERACSMGTTFNTAGLALFQSLRLPGYPLAPAEKPIPVLVYGGSTATGTAAIQLLRLAGFLPLVTCSPGNFDLVRSYGAEAVFDYRLPECAAQIKSYAKNELSYALDCITTLSSMQICYAALGRAGGKYTALDPYPETVAATRKLVKADWVLGPVMLGKEIGWPAPHNREADKEMFEFGMRWRATLQMLMDKELIREHPLQIQEGGLQGVLQGMEDIRAKKISGKKLVYTMSTT